MQSRIVQRSRMEGWGFSLILHGILLLAIVSAFRHLPIPTHREPFRWNVTFAESPQQTASVESDSDVPLANTSHRASEAEVPGSASSQTYVPRPPKQTKNDRNHIAETSSHARPLLATPSPTLMAQLRPETSSPTPSVTQTTPTPQETLAGEQPSTNRTTVPVSRESSVQPETSIEQEIQSPPASSAADTAMAPTQPMDAPPASPQPAPVVASDQLSLPQTDYSWLQRAVSRRLEDLKRSSRPPLDDSSRLKVLVKAVVSSTGELMEVEVVKSSGLDRIDQEAMTLVQRAFPMPLNHTLDRQHIVMRIPITYSRD